MKLKIFFLNIYLLVGVAKILSQVSGISYNSAREIGVIQDSRINEASGMANSRLTEGNYWVHNDSGDGPNLYLINSEGNVLTTGFVSGASSRDWEDITSFMWEGQSYLLIADVGDNPKNKSEYRLFIIKEPVYNANGANTTYYPLVATIKYMYEDGSKDCESVAVDEQEKKIILCTKVGGKNGKVYELPLTLQSSSTILSAQSIATLDVEDPATAMDISSDGQRAIVRTYYDAFEFVRYEGETWNQTFSRTPLKISTPQMGGGESITYGNNSKDLYLVREGSKSPVWEMRGIKEKGIIFQVDLFEIQDLYEEGTVWINFPSDGSSHEMKDAYENKLYYATIDVPQGTPLEFYFSYQNGPDNKNEVAIERGAKDCSNSNGYRTTILNQDLLITAPYIFSACYERPEYVTFRVDMNAIQDKVENGEVWLNIPARDTFIIMKDTDEDGIYSILQPGWLGNEINYQFVYQNGPNSGVDRKTETVPLACGPSEGLRKYIVQSGNITLLAVLFGNCEESVPNGEDITDLTNTIIKGSNDQYTWISATEGQGSPDGQKINKLIDNTNEKYLVRATNSWADIITNRYSKVHAYSITSGSDVPSRDPKDWELLGWNDSTNNWDLLHKVENHASWMQRNQRKSWYFENGQYYSKYRLHVLDMNNDRQGLMQISELQLFGELGEMHELSNDATLKNLSIIGVALSPEFDKDIYSYTAYISPGLIRVTINAEPTVSYALVDGIGTLFYPLSARTQNIEVKAEDNINRSTYTINFEALTSVSEIQKNKISISPNPSKGHLAIEMNLDEFYSFEIFNIHGKKIMNQQDVSGMQNVDLSQFDKGIYFANFDINGAHEIHTIILQ